MAEIPPPPDGFQEIPTPPEGFTAIGSVPPPPDGFQMIGSEGIVDQAKAVGKKILSAGGQALGAMNQFGENFNANMEDRASFDPIASATVTGANIGKGVQSLADKGDVLLGTTGKGEDKGMLGAAAQMLPQTPMQVLLAGGPALAAKGAQLIRGIKPTVTATTAAIQAAAPLAESEEMAAVQAAEHARTTGTSYPSAIAKLKDARDAAYSEVNAARNAIDEFKAANNPALDVRYPRNLEKLQGALDQANEKTKLLGFEIEKLRLDQRTAIPSVDVEAVPPLKATSPFPMPKGVGEAAGKTTPEQVSFASKFVHNEVLADDLYGNVLLDNATNAQFQADLAAQKRGVVPLARSQTLGAEKNAALDAAAAVDPSKLNAAESMAALRPGQIPKGGTLDGIMSQARASQIKAAQDLGEVARMVTSGEAAIEDVSQRIAINWRAMVNSTAVMSEGGRGLSATRLTPLQRAQVKMMNNVMAQALSEDPAAMQKFLGEMAALPKDAIAQQILAAKRATTQLAPDMIDKIMEIRGAGLLSYPVTFLRNTVGNAMATMSNLVERPLAGVVDFMSAKATGTPQQRLIYEGVENGFGMWQGIKSAAADALDVLVNEQSTKGFSSEFAQRQGAIPGKVGYGLRLPFRVLDATDTFFKNILYSGDMRKQAYRQAAEKGLVGAARAEEIERILANPSEEMVKNAIDVAHEFTYQDSLTGSLMHFEKALKAKDPLGVLGKTAVPFFRTPVNVAAFALERTPLMAELTKRGLVRQGFLEGGLTRGQFSDYVARNLVGVSALTASAVALHTQEGLITGAPPKDKTERENLYATRWRPYSIKVGNSYLNYRGFEPISTWLSAIADHAQEVRANPDADYSARAAKITENGVRNFIEQPFVTGIKQILDAIEDPMGGRMQSIARNLAATAVPQGVAGITRTKDTTLRDPETLVEAMMAKTPWLSERIRPKLSRFGEPIQRTTYAMGLADKPLMPGDPVESELLKLGIPKAVGFPDNHMLGRQLNKDEYNELLTIAGKPIREFVGAVLAEPQYAQLPMDKKFGFIRETVTKFRTQAAATIRPQVELRSLGIKSDLDPGELMALNKRIEMPDYKYLKDNDRRAVVNDFIREAKKLR